ncbi:hypothetical protein [Cyanobium sp. NIES-981]|uniref:hypothetical protein n=1 Tax=Cyanobium sp. NIES-981 TaxID=1851505 RepID=UPI0007DCE929|nr:hypothetical protein [Cyanobium sp. NIES-981]SBO42386.1 protein of unknown function [Cyanobium sp. NIES-981]
MPTPPPAAAFPPSAPASLPASSAALISLVDPRCGDQMHWWLEADGFPQRIAGLLGAPLRSSGQPATTTLELLEVFSPLPVLPAAAAHPACRTAGYRYLLCGHRHGFRLSCWRQHPGTPGWQRRCGPMALPAFIRHFAAPRDASS